jgi:hypothetical protein
VTLITGATGLGFYDRPHDGWETDMRSTVRQLITGVAVAVALSAVGVGAIGGAIAQSPQRMPPLAQDGLVSGYNAAPLAVGGRLADRQQLQHYFLDGPRDRLR